jgi:hypothetical protein
MCCTTAGRALAVLCVLQALGAGAMATAHNSLPGARHATHTVQVALWPSRVMQPARGTGHTSNLWHAQGVSTAAVCHMEQWTPSLEIRSPHLPGDRTHLLGLTLQLQRAIIEGYSH